MLCVQSVDEKQLEGRENLSGRPRRAHLPGVSSIGDPGLPSPLGAHSPLQETDVKQLILQ